MIGSLVRPIRRRLDWSQEQLAEHVGNAGVLVAESRSARRAVDRRRRSSAESGSGRTPRSSRNSR